MIEPNSTVLVWRLRLNRRLVAVVKRQQRTVRTEAKDRPVFERARFVTAIVDDHAVFYRPLQTPNYRSAL